MLSYQHAYHAGGPADLHKHAAFAFVLAHLASKDKPFVIVDLHAGHGLYDLTSAEAGKTQEYAGGIGRLWPLAAANPPAAAQPFAACVTSFNPEGLRIYPGSPAIARAFLRHSDALILNELHPAALADLRRWAGPDQRIAIHKRDSQEALLALVPPTIRRGVVLLDPSYEMKDEYASLPGKIAAAVRKWREGCYLVWYPVLAEGRHEALITGLQDQVDGSLVRCELTLRPGRGKAATGLLGTGLVVINPPWQFDKKMTEIGNWLAERLTSSGRHDVRWLKGSPSAP